MYLPLPMFLGIQYRSSALFFLVALSSEVLIAVLRNALSVVEGLRYKVLQLESIHMLQVFLCANM